MNTEEYNIKIKELRKEKDFHYNEARRLEEEMDKLVNHVDNDKIDWIIGKYIKIDRRSKGGYLEFFYVDSIENRPRGYTFYGKGFDISDLIIRIDNTCTFFLENDNINKITEISKEDFYKAFDEYVRLMREKLSDVKNYKSLGDQFEFKNSIIKTTMELNNENSIPNKILEIIKAK